MAMIPKEFPCYTLSEFGEHVFLSGVVVFFKPDVNRVKVHLCVGYASYQTPPPGPESWFHSECVSCLEVMTKGDI